MQCGYQGSNQKQSRLLNSAFMALYGLWASHLLGALVF
jgi:hypothetical protein